MTDEPIPGELEPERLLEIVSRSMHDAVIIIDSESVVHSWNKGAENIFGYSEQEMIGQSLIRVIPGRFRQAHQHGVRRFNETGASHVVGTPV